MKRKSRYFSGWSARVGRIFGRTPTTRVSVVINTLNRCESLERTLVALRDQTYRPFEVIVVNGPSSDGTEVMLEKFANSARLISCPEARIGLSRNIGAAAAAGKIVAYTDDDAIPRPDWLEALVAGFADDSVGAVGGTVFDVPLGRIEWKLCTCNRLGAPNTDSPGPIDDYLGRGADPFAYLAGCNMAFRRSALVAVDGFNSQFAWGYDDVDICCRIIDAGYRIAFVEDAFVSHDRAQSAVRDGCQVLRDPYMLAFARAVFALQCHPSPYSVDEITRALEASMEDWRWTAGENLARGLMTEEEQQRFIARAEEGIRDGIEAGRGTRPDSLLPAPPIDSFYPYVN
jgi:GT2 family glycosyltransferase